jgi:hypothetical protein
MMPVTIHDALILFGIYVIFVLFILVAGWLFDVYILSKMD